MSAGAPTTALTQAPAFFTATLMPNLHPAPSATPAPPTMRPDRLLPVEGTRQNTDQRARRAGMPASPPSAC